MKIKITRDHMYFKFIELEYAINIYKFTKYIELRYDGIEKFMVVSYNDVVILLKFGMHNAQP